MLDKFITSGLSLRRKYKIVREAQRIKLKTIANEIKVSVPMLSMYENELVNLSRDKELMYRKIIINGSGSQK
ncbi:transcriptional regulator [Niallia circulans]|nr:transcriptional regulator [Niallia circulans]